MGELVTTASVLMCPHGGTVQIITSNTRTKAGGAYVARTSDTFIVAGCSFVMGSNPHPCTTVEWSTGAARVDAMSGDVVTRDNVGLCKAANGAVQGPVNIASTQPRVKGL